jgi:glycosyltransferase involved in cell wall biosynthesis
MSLYLQRLSARLRDVGIRVVVVANNGGTEVVDGVVLRRARPGRSMVPDVLGVLRSEGIDLLHFHTFGAGWKEILPWGVFHEASGVPVIVSQHSFDRDLDEMSPFERTMTRLWMGRLSRTVCSGGGVLQKLLALGVASERICQVTPFIAPTMPDLAEHPFPAEIEALKERCSPLVASGTGRLVVLNGKDLYGLDVFVRAAKQVVQRLPAAGLVYLIAHHGDERLLEESRQYVRDNGLSDNVCIHVGDLSATLMWAAGDIFVRPTIDDGDAVSLREAMFLGVPSIASDVVARPEGCRTYRGGDADDCARVIIEVARDLAGSRALVSAHRPAEGVDDLLAVYQQVLEERSWFGRLRSSLLGGGGGGR